MKTYTKNWSDYQSPAEPRTSPSVVILSVLASVLALDLFGFIAWFASNQSPADGFYIGAITANIIKLFY